MALPLGRELGPFRIERELGTGGMGKVFLATVEGDVPGLGPGTPVAVKLVHPHLMAMPGLYERFKREAEIGRAVEHPNVVRTFDAGVVRLAGGPEHILVMEYVQGQTLRELLGELGRAPEELCRHVGREIASGLAAIHDAGAVHRDLKPENVLVTRENSVKVMDLGVAHLMEEVIRLSRPGVVVGTYLYAAPEQFDAAGGAGVDGRADLYALGLLLYELAAGRHPFPGTEVSEVVRWQLETTPRPLGQVNPQVSPFLEELVAVLVAKERDARFRSAYEVAEVLRAGETSAWWRTRATEIRSQTRRALRRMRVPRDTRVYGRGDELARLRGVFDAVRAGDGRVLLIEGEAGIGKTRLVDDFVEELRRAGTDADFLFGGYAPGGAATVAGAFTSAYGEHLGTEDLEETLAAHLPETPLLVPAFAALLRGDATPPGQETLTKESLQSVFVHLTRSLAADRPLIVLIDDLHFAPAEGRALFAALALAVPGHRVLLIGTTRPGGTTTWAAGLERLEQTQTLRLARLGPKDLGKLLVEAFGSERLAEDLGYAILTKSDGNPFFVFEIIRGLREKGLIARTDDGSWVGTRLLDDVEIPSSVLEMVQGRIADLDEADRDLLDLASCCGFEFDPSLLGDVTGSAAIPLLKRLAQIERAHRLVRSRGRNFTFDHHQVQEALYRGLPEMLREEYHAALGEALAARAGDAGSVEGPTAVQLARHFLAGARSERALPHVDAALGHLEETCRHDAAAKLLAGVLDTPGLLGGKERLERLLARIGKLILLGRHEERREAVEEVQRLADELGDTELQIVTRLSAGEFLRHSGRLDDAVGTLEAALDLAAGSDELRVRTLSVLGRVRNLRGDHAAAQEHLERALSLATQLGDPELEATTLGALGILLAGLGRLGESAQRFERARRIWRDRGHRSREAAATGNLGLAMFRLGRYDQARAHLERHLALSRELGDRPGESTARGNLGHVLQALGRFDEARLHHERDLALSREIGDRQGEANANGAMGNLMFALGLYAESQRYHDTHRRISREMGYREGAAIAAVNLGDVALVTGRLDEAERCIDQSLAECRAIGARYPEGYALARLGRLAEQRGDLAGARAHHEDALRVRREIGHRDGVANSLVHLGRLALREQRTDDARLVLEEALRIAEAMNAPGARVLAAAYLARLPGSDATDALEAFARVGDRLAVCETTEACFAIWEATGMREYLRRARELVAEQRDNVADSWRDSFVDDVPIHGAIWHATPV